MTNSQPDYNWTSWKQGVEFEGQTLVADKLDRAQYAKFLTGYLNDAGQRDGGYVINLNAEWGAGKTWFLKRWCATLKPHHPVAYIDAWKNDFSDDPLLTVVSGVLEALKQNPDVNFYKHEKGLFEKVGYIAKTGTPALLKGLLKTWAGVDADDLLDEGLAEGVGEAFQNLVGGHQQKLKSLDDSRKAIANWLYDVTNGPGANRLVTPMYVFIDELDRCRPTYAIELLETVKHLFEIQGIVFVIATNTDQLQHSIRAVYGDGFDANRYLYRFFNRSFSLHKPVLKDYLNSLAATEPLWEKLQTTLGGDLQIKDRTALEDMLASMAEFFGMDLRSCSQWLDQCLGMFATKRHVDDYFWPYLAIFAAMKLQFPDLYNKLYRDRLDKADKSKEDKYGWDFDSKLLGDYEEKLGGKYSLDFILQRERVVTWKITKANNTLVGGLPEHCPVRMDLSFSALLDISKSFTGYRSRPKSIEHTHFVDDAAFIDASHLFFGLHEPDPLASRELYLSLVDMAYNLK